MSPPHRPSPHRKAPSTARSVDDQALGWPEDGFRLWWSLPLLCTYNRSPTTPIPGTPCNQSPLRIQNDGEALGLFGLLCLVESSSGEGIVWGISWGLQLLTSVRPPQPEEEASTLVGPLDVRTFHGEREANPSLASIPLSVALMNPRHWAQAGTYCP